MKKMNFLVIGLLLMSIVVMSGCTDNKSSDTSVPAEENSDNVPPNSTMPPAGEVPGNISPNSTMPPGNPDNMPPNSTMSPGNPPAENPENMS